MYINGFLKGFFPGLKCELGIILLFISNDAFQSIDRLIFLGIEVFYACKHLYTRVYVCII